MPLSKNKFLKLTKIESIFGHWCDSDRPVITKMPDLPDSLTEIGLSSFDYQNIQTVVIPKQVKTIGSIAFYNSNVSTLIFEEGSELETIDNEAFSSNNLSGNLVFPKTIKLINWGSFTGNNLTSVTFPSSATYFENKENEWDNSFDQGVTINHNY